MPFPSPMHESLTGLNTNLEPGSAVLFFFSQGRYIYINNFIYLFLAVLSLRCHVGFSLAVVSKGCSLVAVASLVEEHGLWGAPASVVAARGLMNCGS